MCTVEDKKQKVRSALQSTVYTVRRRAGPGNMREGIGPDGRALREKTGSVKKSG
jgi:hypothetical protein